MSDIFQSQRGRRNTTFGVDFQEQVDRYKTQVPPIITQCLAEIERRGVMIKVKRKSYSGNIYPVAINSSFKY